MDEYFCPNCGAILNNQSGFDPDRGSWTCTECGQHLVDDDIYESDTYEGVAWYCDSCGTLLNRQSGFTDSGSFWRCTSCGHLNWTTEDEIIDNEHNRDDNDDDDDDDDDVSTSNSLGSVVDNILAAAYAINVLENAKRRHEARIRREKRRLWRSNHKAAICFVVLFSIIILFSAIAYYEYIHLLPIGVSSRSLEGIEYTTAVHLLEEAGFPNIRMKEIADLTISRSEEENLVTDVRLAYGGDFAADTKYPSNLWITVVYHTVELYKPPLTSKDAKGMDYLDAIEKFEAKGFVNITTVVEYDIITGWLTDDGAVKSVTIDGEKNYDYYDEYRPDAEVVITYHTFRKNQ